MAQVAGAKFEVGQLTSAAAVNKVYTDTATVSGDIDTDNTRSEWVSRRHMTSNLVMPWWGYVETPGTGGSYNSATYVDITHTNALKLSPTSLIMHKGDVLRIQGNIRSGESALGGASDDYAFTFYWTRDDGGGNVTEQVSNCMDYWYGLATQETAPAGGEEMFNWSRHGFTHIYVHQSVTPRKIVDVTMRVKVEDPVNGITALKLREGDMLVTHWIS